MTAGDVRHPGAESVCIRGALRAVDWVVSAEPVDGPLEGSLLSGREGVDVPVSEAGRAHVVERRER